MKHLKCNHSKAYIRGIAHYYIGGENVNKYSVYMHRNKINDKVYIGITCQVPEYRWKKDGKGYVECPLFWNAINKYGWDNFEHTIIENGLDADRANEMEIALIREYDSANPAHGYNLSKGGFGVNTETMTEKWQDAEFKAFMSKRMQEAWKDEDKRRERSQNAKKRWSNPDFKAKVKEAVKNACASSVVCVETGRVFDSISDVEHELGLSHSNICRAIRTGYKCGGYHWKYVEDVSKKPNDYSERK